MWRGWSSTGEYFTKSFTFAWNLANFSRKNFKKNFDKNINFNAKLMQNCIEDDMIRRNCQNIEGFS